MSPGRKTGRARGPLVAARLWRMRAVSCPRRGAVTTERPNGAIVGLRLSKPQRELLEELANGGLYIRQYGSYGRTVRSLERRRLVRCDEPDYSRLAQHYWVLTELGASCLR